MSEQPLDDEIEAMAERLEYLATKAREALIEMVSLEERLALCAAHLERMRP